MANKLKELRKDFIGKVEQLEKVKEILKTEFVGINPIIDDIVDNVRSWYIMSSIQDRPLVINLWGLTGVGKTSLIIRLMELLDFSDRTYRLDLGEKEGSMSFRNALSDLCDNKDDSPIVIMLDEFQHARTLKANGPFKEEIDNDKTRMVWELIDSGKITYIDWKRGMWSYEDLILKLKKLLNNGVVVHKGIVTAGRELYQKEMNVTFDENEPIHFIPVDEYATIIDLAGNVLNFHLQQDVEKEVMSMNGRETIDFLFKIFRIAQQPSVKNFTKSLIIILGNIDEAYTMSGNFSSEISADDFHQQSLKITLPQMKEALRSRFRDEQIARLGNRHIIYPALSKSAYYQIIDLQLEALNKKMQDQFHIEISFDQSVKEILYKEGVFPTQGARPLLTTIQSIINSRMSIYLNKILKNDLNTDQIKLYFQNENQLCCGFYENGILKFTYTDTLQLNLESLRKSKYDELQTIAAVHESGHAILSTVLMHNLPELVVSVTSDTESVGFVYSKNQRDFLAKHELLPKAAVLLGGLAAEEIIFGEENVTAGAASDLAAATSFIMRMLKRNGMGTKSIHYASSPIEESMSYHETSAIEEEALAVLEQAKELAMKTLIKERSLLLVLSKELSIQSRLEKAELKELIQSHAVSAIVNLEGSTFYRDKLNAQIATNSILKKVNNNHPIQMNKNN